MDQASTARAEPEEALYQRLIMERARQPLHAGVLDPADRAADGNNPFCGDKVHVTLSLSAAGQVAEVRHQTRGCAICMAAADLMAESVQGLDDAAISSLFGRFDVMVHGGLASLADATRPGDAEQVSGGLGLLNAFGNLHEYRSRIRCATLPWTALLDALKSGRTL